MSNKSDILWFLIINSIYSASVSRKKKCRCNRDLGMPGMGAFFLCYEAAASPGKHEGPSWGHQVPAEVYLGLREQHLRIFL